MRQVLLLYNNRAGKGKFKNQVVTILNYLNLHKFTFDVHIILDDENITETIMEMAPNYESIILGGGDGTLNSVVNGLMQVKKESRPKILLVPFGTANDIADYLNIEKDLSRNLALLQTNKCLFVDIYQINNKYFTYATAWGKFSNVSYTGDRKYVRKFGKLTYLLNAVIDIFRKYKTEVTIQIDDQEITTKTFLIMAAKGSRFGGFNLKHFKKKGEQKDPHLNLRIFTSRNPFSWLKGVFFFFMQGRKFKHALHFENIKDVKIFSNHPGRWNIDGERGPNGNVEISVINDAICFYTPALTN